MPFLISLLLRLGVPERFAGLAAKVLVYGVAAIVVLVGLWRAYSAIYDAGAASVQAKWDAAQRAAEAKAAADSLALQSTFGAIDSDLTTDMEGITNVRTVYRDKVRTTAVDVYRDRAVACTLPDSLLGQINAAAASYAAAATGAGSSAVRSSPAAP